ncbi:MAG: hypothetical protein AAGK04_08285 [Planctomycetota bacterium]
MPVLTAWIELVPVLAEKEPLFSMDNILGVLAVVLVTFGGAVAAWWAKVKGKFGGGDDQPRDE